MKIAYITAGAAGMYCGSCMHDNTLAAALSRAGEDVILVPVYTPIRTDEVDVSHGEVFYGAVNVYLQQTVGLFRHTPRVLDRLLDSRALLDRIARLGASTSPDDLGALTLSMLQGEDGRQAKELRRLVEWLRNDFAPDIVHLTNSMLVGMARTIRNELGVPVVCSVQGEDLFLDQLPASHRDAALSCLRERARDVDRFVAPSRYYGDHMAPYLGLDASEVAVVPLGIRLDDFESRQRLDSDQNRFVIGYLARVAPEKGLHNLIEAARHLADAIGPERLVVRAAGYLGPRDRAYFERVQAQVADAGLSRCFEYLGEVDRRGKTDFLRSLDVLSVPTVYREAKGLFALEAMASGIPVVLPDHGSLSEMVASTGGGVLVEPGSSRHLADALLALHEKPALGLELGRAGRAAVMRSFGADTMATATTALYRDVLDRR